MNRTRSNRSFEVVFEKLLQCRRLALLYRLATEATDVWLRELTEPHAAQCCVREWGMHYRTWFGPELAEHLRWSVDKYRERGVSQETLEQLQAVIDEAIDPCLEASYALD